MAEQIRLLTDENLKLEARTAAEWGVPLDEAVRHLEHDRELAREFAQAYHEALEAA